MHDFPYLLSDNENSCVLYLIPVQSSKGELPKEKLPHLHRSLTVTLQAVSRELRTVSNMFQVRQLFMISSLCLSSILVILSMSSFLTAAPKTTQSIETTDDTPIAWCILDGNNSNLPHFPHFPHASQVLLPCWSYFSRVREQTPDARCGFWLDSDKLKLSKGWVEGLVSAMNCVVANTQPVNMQISLRPNNTRSFRWYQSPSDAKTLRTLTVGPLTPNSHPQIGLVQRSKSKRDLRHRTKRKGNRHISNLPEIQVSIEQAFPNATVDIAFMERMSFAQQAEWWSRHDVVVAAHGAGVTNLIFMRDNASVVELYPDHYYPVDLYYSLCESVGVKHYGWYNGVTDPEADFREHGQNVKDRNLYRNVDMTPPVQQVVELVRRAVHG
jgi:hypothetical protein